MEAEFALRSRSDARVEGRNDMQGACSNEILTPYARGTNLALARIHKDLVDVGQACKLGRGMRSRRVIIVPVRVPDERKTLVRRLDIIHSAVRRNVEE